MAQFDVHDFKGNLVVDCQSDLLARLETRFVVPLVLRGDSTAVAKRLNPVFQIGGHQYVMLTQAASAVRGRELGPAITSLAEHSFEITGALDVLLTGV